MREITKAEIGTELARTIQLIDVNGGNRIHNQNMQIMNNLAERNAKRKARIEELKTNITIAAMYLSPIALVAIWLLFGY